jgi:hypothetical protein
MVACQVGDAVERVGFGRLYRSISRQYQADSTEDIDNDIKTLLDSMPREGHFVRSWQEIRLG